MASTAQEMVPVWLGLDRDPASRAQVEQLAAGARWEQLEELLCRRLEFGTAGLRGKMVRACAPPPPPPPPAARCLPPLPAPALAR
jgi:hypothetical protein